NIAPKRTGREPCERPRITILASSEADQLLVGQASLWDRRTPPVKTIRDCLRGRDQYGLSPRCLYCELPSWAVARSRPGRLHASPWAVLERRQRYPAAAAVAARVAAGLLTESATLGRRPLRRRCHSMWRSRRVDAP